MKMNIFIMSKSACISNSALIRGSFQGYRIESDIAFDPDYLIQYEEGKYPAAPC